jgi:hypothetical protein
LNFESREIGVAHIACVKIKLSSGSHRNTSFIPPAVRINSHDRVTPVVATPNLS